MIDDSALRGKWDDIRDRFRSSMMVQTEVFKLAQNIDASWPLRGKEETPEKYLSLTIDELQFFPEFKDKPERLPLLISILEETLAFDDPFGEMVEYVDSSSKKDESATHSLEKLGIPKNFPIALTHVSADTKDFCQGEDLSTIYEFISFAQSMAQNIVVGGDFKKLLNCLTHLDETTIRNYIPIRKGETGVYLAEGIGLFVNTLKPEEKAYLFKIFNLTPNIPMRTRPLGKTEQERLNTKLEEQMKLLFDFFEEEGKTLTELMNQELKAQERFFVSLNNPDSETLAWALASFHIFGHPASRKKGLLNRLFNR